MSVRQKRALALGPTRLGSNAPPPGIPYSGFGPVSYPANVSAQNDGSYYTLGTAFRTTLSGQAVRGGRIWVNPTANTAGLTTDGLQFALWQIDTSTGYTPSSGLLAQTPNVKFPQMGQNGGGANVNVAGWAEIAFPDDYRIAANVDYLIACTVSSYVYSATGGYFTTADVPAPSGALGLILRQDTTAAHNGQYADGTTYGDRQPIHSFNGGFYGVDVTLIGT